ncbi:glycosyltransferase [Staphylococcus schleiferi]|uniref:glycosyltransferase n=1 Tax=Staphylococcus schleiferi TaxID=1295 RepID=UPI0024816801|nr:glycosyltransferase [Staphylococcus schleiferi]
MIYTITSTLPKEHGGRTKSLLQRINLLKQQLNIDNVILTTNYNIEYPEIQKTFFEKGILDSSITHENIYDWLSGYRLYAVKRSRFKSRPFINESPREIEGLTSKVSKKDNDIVRYYDQERYVLYRKYYAKSNILELEDFMDDISKRRIERRKYNQYGYIHQKIVYHPKTFGKQVETFYDGLGYPYCVKYYTSDAKPKLSLIRLVDQEGRPYRFFDNEKALFRYYFESKFQDGDIVFNDARLLDRPLLFNKKKTKNILVFHNTHLQNDDTSVLKSYQFALENSNAVFKYLILTNHQKEDIQAKYGISNDKFVVIPHSIDHTDSHNIEHARKDFVFIGRFSVQKQLTHLIRAYKLFKDKGYEDKLHLYGKDEDDQLKMIKSLIKELDLEESVEINGFTSNPLDVFSRAKASLLTSLHEGFGLTIMESIKTGCPVVSYDVKYGPREIIDHESNGYLVTPQNIEEFASRMEDIVNQPLQNVQLTSRLYQSTAIENYKTLFNSLGYTDKK